MNISVEEASEFLVRDRCRSPVLKKGAVLLAPYVDNSNAILYDLADGAEFYRILMDVLTGLGFTLKDLVKPTQVFDMIGIIFHGSRLTFEHRGDRFWKLYFALAELESFGHIRGEVVRKIAGHLVNFMMLDRAALACLSETYKSITSHVGSVAAIPLALRSKLKVIKGVLSLIFHNACRHTAPWVYCSDASTQGYALHVASGGHLLAHDAASYRERWRFKEQTLEAQSVGVRLIFRPSRLPLRSGCSSMLISISLVFGCRWSLLRHLVFAKFQMRFPLCPMNCWGRPLGGEWSLGLGNVLTLYTSKRLVPACSGSGARVATLPPSSPCRPRWATISASSWLSKAAAHAIER